MAANGLTPKQQAFCKEYIVDLNAAQAAVRAGYSPNTANREGSRLLSNVDIQSEVQRLMKERSDRLAITADQVLRELAIISFSDPTRYTMDPQTGALSVDTACPEVWRAVSSVKRKVRTTPGGTEVEAEFRLWPKVESLKLLGQHLGMFEAKEKPQLETVLEFLRTILGEDACRRIGELVRQRERPGDAGGAAP